jgi:hypothetical protein
MADDEDDTPNPPRNYSRNIEDLKVCGSVVVAVDDDSSVGILTMVTRVGQYDFLINQELANQILQQLREYVRGDSEKLPDG